MKLKISLFVAVFAAMIAFTSNPSKANSDPLAFIQLQQTQSQSFGNGSERPRRKAAGLSASHVESAANGQGPAAAVVANLAAQHGVPRSLALAVCSVESRCRFGLVGAAGERGPMQIKLATAQGLGYSGNAAGLNGYAGAYWGVKHLAVAYQKCGTARGAARLHNAGLASSCGGSAYTSRVMARM